MVVLKVRKDVNCAEIEGRPALQDSEAARALLLFGVLGTPVTPMVKSLSPGDRETPKEQECTSKKGHLDRSLDPLGEMTAHDTPRRLSSQEAMNDV